MIQLGDVDGGFGCDLLTQRSVRTLVWPPRFGSRRSLATASAIDPGEMTMFVGGVNLTASSDRAGGDSTLISTASATALVRERTTKLLFDIPCLEFHAPIQIHSKTGGDVERLEKTNDCRVFNYADPGVTGPPYRLQITPRVGVRVRRKPNLQKKHTCEQRELRHAENLRSAARGASMSCGEPADP